MCDCEFTPYKDSDEESWHFLRVCEFCGHEWYGLHCPHDGYQNPCPECDKRPTTIIFTKEENKMSCKQIDWKEEFKWIGPPTRTRGDYGPTIRQGFTDANTPLNDRRIWVFDPDFGWIHAGDVGDSDWQSTP